MSEFILAWAVSTIIALSLALVVVIVALPLALVLMTDTGWPLLLYFPIFSLASVLSISVSD